MKNYTTTQVPKILQETYKKQVLKLQIARLKHEIYHYFQLYDTIVRYVLLVT